MTTFRFIYLFDEKGEEEIHFYSVAHWDIYNAI